MSANSRFPVAVHVMTALAYQDGRAVTSSLLAKSVRTNPVVIRRMLGQLVKAGLVSTQPGKSGGCQLARRAETITLFDIYKAVEGGGPFALPDKAENKACAVSCQMKKLMASLLAETERAISTSLEKVRLSDVVRDVAAAAA